jgi:hypothetical protein
VKILLILLIFSSKIYSTITFEDLDYIRSFTDEDSKSIIESGTDFCTNYFDKNFLTTDNKFKNFFLCKFSNKRNRFYVYMLAVDKKDKSPIKEFCLNLLNSWPEIYDHMDENLNYQKKNYLKGFFVENFYNNKILNFSNNFLNDQRLINNEINKFIIENRSNFSENNKDNNNIVQKEIHKLNKIYKKILSRTDSNLDLLIKTILNDVVRYKIFVNDTKNFISYSCNWQPKKGFIPYVKREKFSEFEKI